MVTHTCHSNILDTGKGRISTWRPTKATQQDPFFKKQKLTVRGGAFTQPLGWQWQADLCKSKASATQQVLGQPWLCSEIPSQKHKQTKNTVKKSNEHKVKIDRNLPQPSIRGTWFLLTYSMSFHHVMQNRFPNEHTFTGRFSSGCRPSGSSTE